MSDGILKYGYYPADNPDEEREMVAKLKASIELCRTIKKAPDNDHRGVHARQPGAQKDNSKKRRWYLLPWEAAGLVVDVLMYGAYDASRPDGSKGYGEYNWRGIPTAEYLDAAVRHMNDWRAGEWQDPESKLPHLAHAVTCLIFALAQTERKDGCK